MRSPARHPTDLHRAAQGCGRCLGGAQSVVRAGQPDAHGAPCSGGQCCARWARCARSSGGGGGGSRLAAAPRGGWSNPNSLPPTGWRAVPRASPRPPTPQQPATHSSAICTPRWSRRAVRCALRGRCATQQHLLPPQSLPLPLQPPGLSPTSAYQRGARPMPPWRGSLAAAPSLTLVGHGCTMTWQTV
jgi:hypothetical protein